MLDSKIGRRNSLMDVELSHPHPYFKELRPMLIIGQQRKNNFWLGWKQDMSRRTNSTAGLRLNL